MIILLFAFPAGAAIVLCALLLLRLVFTAAAGILRLTVTALCGLVQLGVRLARHQQRVAVGP